VSGRRKSSAGCSRAPRPRRRGPIAGTNDDGTVFSTANAQSLESFAAANGVHELSFWEVDGYDKPTGYQYSSIFNQITQ
jgi:chitinase